MESRGRLKERLARMFRASILLRSSCSSTTSNSILSSGTATSSRTFSTDIAHEPVFIPREHRHRPPGEFADIAFFLNDRTDGSLSFPSTDDHLRNRSTRLSLDCGGCRPTHTSEADIPKKKKKKKERRVRETGGFYETGDLEGRTCPPASPSTPSSKNCAYYYYCFNRMAENEDEKIKKRRNYKKNMSTYKKKKKKKKKQLLSNGYGFSSSSSMDSDDGFGFFSSDEEMEEMDTFFSSRSFSSDSSEFYQRPSSNTKKKKKEEEKKQKNKKMKKKKEKSDQGFLPLVSVSSREEEEQKGGFAVMKKSSDPYEDFRSSMVEMVVERQIFGAGDLERLLRCYLSLNSPQHHQVIIRAFTDIWEVLFGH